MLSFSIKFRLLEGRDDVLFGVSESHMIPDNLQLANTHVGAFIFSDPFHLATVGGRVQLSLKFLKSVFRSHSAMAETKIFTWAVVTGECLVFHSCLCWQNS